MLSMKTQLRVLGGHLVARIGSDDWIVDTGSPASFGQGVLHLDGESVEIADGYMGLSARQLSEYVGFETYGVIGTDVLNRLDVVLDLACGGLHLSDTPHALDGARLPIDDFVMGVPVVGIPVAGRKRAMFFDTGAPLSYLQDDDLSEHPPAGMERDFFPGVGEFETATHLVPMGIGPLSMRVRCGSLPGLLGMTLGLTGVAGVLGSEMLLGRCVGYFARRRELVIA